MKAMVLAAGLGTRLRPLTDERPKALAEIGGRTLLEITLARLRRFGIEEVIINVHHLADMVVEYLRKNNGFGMRIEISREATLLDTGGGLLKAADFFLREESADGDGEAFLLHNVDVLSAIDLEQMVRFHQQHRPLATLAVQQRKSSRYLLMDAQMQLCGRLAAGEPQAEMARPAAQVDSWAFAGIHMLSPQIFRWMREQWPSGAGRGAEKEQTEPAFPIVSEYLRLAGQGEKLLGFRADGYYWRDLGTAASLEQAAEDAAAGLVAL